MFRLIFLQMSDHMPLNPMANLFDLFPGFLHVVLPEDGHARLDGFLNPSGLYGLRDGDQLDLSRVTAGPSRRLIHSLQNPQEIIPYR